MVKAPVSLIGDVLTCCFASAGIDAHAERSALGPLHCVVSESGEVIEM